MMARLSPTQRAKLVKICGRLGSNHDGERAAAALLASRLLTEAGLDWEQVLSASAIEPFQAATEDRNFMAEMRAARERAARNPWGRPGQHPDLRFLWENSDYLTGDERVALSQKVNAARSDLTPRQAKLVAFLLEQVKLRMKQRGAAA
ncbi:hypothetical protein BSA145_21245 (plasmid) [Bacillus safensis]|uniref:Uncharacterized protein n=1 Tax=Bacillus safensis TaxID=561879 RepID=A0A1L6ZPG9_BACIA|nr:hypothetical protein [Bacillus safensis]APT48395.1 hypothetical protein BSA145_21245 [Bacillus safensis]